MGNQLLHGLERLIARLNIMAIQSKSNFRDD